MDNNCTNSALSEEYFDFISDYELQPEEVLASMNICYNRIDSIFTSIYAPLNQYSTDVLDTYGYKVYARLFGLLDYPSLEASGITRVRAIPSLRLRGQGVLIGIVDTGIDYTHPAFINADNTTKIVSIWDQTIQSGTPPEGINFGTVFSREQINNALQNNNPIEIVPSTDEIGHGTFLAGVVAGNEDNENSFSGVVPNAEIVVVKLKPAKQNIRKQYLIHKDTICYQENDIMLGIKYLYETARRLNRPISICIGLGTAKGAHDDNGALSRYLSTLGQLDGVAISVAAGNEGNSRHHYEALLRNNVNSDTVELNVGANETGFAMEIWEDAPNTFSIDLVSPSGEYVPRISPRLAERRTIGFIFESTIIRLYFQIVGSRSGAQLVIMTFTEPSEGIWKIIIHKGNKALDLKFNMWLPMTGFIEEDTYFLRSSAYTTLTSPANSIIPIVATAYDVSNGSLYINASRGYTRTNEIAPVLAAPGVNVLGPSINNNYELKSGTSIAAAHTTGIAAMLLEWGKVNGFIEYLDGADIKNLLVRGAKNEANQEYPNREWGYGIIDIIGTFESIRGNI